MQLSPNLKRFRKLKKLSGFTYRDAGGDMLLTQHKKRLSMLKAWALHDASIYRTFIETLQRYGYAFDGMRILDMGCGANAPLTLMLHSAGAHITGVDAYIGHRWGLGFRLRRYVSYVKEAGLVRTLRKSIGELVYDRHYYISLTDALGFDLTEKGIDLREVAAEDLPFDDETFDAIYSNATWEHLVDVRTVNQEVARVLRPGGLAYIEIHLFPSLSGGHDLPWIVPGKTEMGNIAPWGHLRNASWQAPVYLNRLREKDYHRLFAETPKLEIVEWITEYTEGEGLITDELLEELSDYTEEELTKRSIVVIIRKRSIG
jgi:SAM-dependent methyltransferase